jgi:hypothetical protein
MTHAAAVHITSEKSNYERLRRVCLDLVTNSIFRGWDARERYLRLSLSLSLSYPQPTRPHMHSISKPLPPALLPRPRARPPAATHTLAHSRTLFLYLLPKVQRGGCERERERERESEDELSCHAENECEAGLAATQSGLVI